MKVPRPLQAGLAAVLLAALLLAVPLAVQAATERGLIWRVTRDGTPTSYLLGSIHVGRADMYPLPDTMQQAYRRSDALVVEADIVAADLTHLSSLVREKGTYHDGGTLKDAVDAAAWSDIRAAAKRCGMPLSLLQGQKPWLAYSTLTLLAVQAKGYSEQYGIDRHFLEQAHEDNKPVLELEGVEQQFQVLSGMPEDKQSDLLAYTAGQIADGDVPMAQLVGAWRSGRPEQLEAQVSAHFPSSLQGVYDALVVQRNRAMADRLDRLLDGRRALLVVVGAAHMTGPTGLVKQLRQRGYRVEQM